MIDIHCHLNFHSFENDYDEVAKRAFTAGITKIVNVGTQISSSRQAVEFAEKYADMYAIVGVHPHHADKPDQNWLEELEQIATHEKVIGIGECGVDYYSYASNGVVDPDLQRNVFIKQIELAHKLHLPLQIHHRQAEKDLMDILESHKSLFQNPPGMFHCFAGSMEFLKQALDLGFSIGFDGNITYPGFAKGETTRLADLAKYTPLDRIVIETDSPYLTPQPHRGSRNEPKYAIITGQFIAELKGVSYTRLEEVTTNNVSTVFPKIHR